MRQLAFKSTFKKDLKRMSKRGAKLAKLETILVTLQNNQSLPASNRPHMLSGSWRGFMECHIAPDWLLIYDLETTDTVNLHRTGTHADLFE
jgi:mRNA interferase YafQ